MAKNAHDFSFKKIDNGAIHLSDFKGKVIMVVNTASKCGFTKQYAGLEELYQEYKNKGLVVIGVPSNDFGGQEPGSNEEIRIFCKTTYDVSFPLAQKVKVKGSDPDPFYAWAKEESGVAPKWNFYKYVIGKDGEMLDYFSSMTSPNSKKIIKLLEENL